MPQSRRFRAGPFQTRPSICPDFSAAHHAHPDPQEVSAVSMAGRYLRGWSILHAVAKLGQAVLMELFPGQCPWPAPPTRCSPVRCIAEVAANQTLVCACPTRGTFFDLAFSASLPRRPTRFGGFPSDRCFSFPRLFAKPKLELPNPSA